MVEEKMVTSVTASPTAVGDGHKRKLDDLEVNSLPEPLIDHELISDPVSVNDALDGDKNGGADESDAKRPRLERNGDNNINEADGLVSQNGNREEQKQDEPELGKSEEEEAEQVVSVNNSVSVEVQEPVETITEEAASNENEELEIKGAVDLPQAKAEVEEPSVDLGKTEAEVEESSQSLGQNEAEVREPSQDLEQTKIGVEEISQDVGQTQAGVEELSQEAVQINTGVEDPSHNLGQAKEEVGEPSHDLGQAKEEVGEPCDEVPREGDVAVASADMESGFDTQVLSRKIEVPNDKVGVIIGKAGDTIRSLQDNSGAKIQIMRDADADPRSTTRPLELVGTLKNVNKAEKLIRGVIAEADAGGSPSLIARGFNTVQAASGGEQVEIQVPFEKVGLIIGKGGETIRNLQTRSGARIQLLQHNLSGGDQSKERTVRMTGTKKQIETAREMIKDVMSQNVRPSLSGGHGQQGFHPHGPASPQWGHRGPHAQFSSGYNNYPQQRGPYSSQGSQYPPPTYGNYLPQQGPPRSNFGPSWEQRPPPSMHGPSAQGNYNYGQQQGPDYGHQPPYSQPPSQPYGQGGYQHTPSQPYGPMGSQPAPYAQSGYGPQDQFGKPPPTYGMQPQVQQPYVQPRPSQPGEIPYQGQVPSNQPYVQNVPAQQSYPYAPPNGQMQQNYPPPYGSAPLASGYPQGGQPGYTQPVGAQQQQPGVYPQAGPGGGYGSYPTGYAEQPGASTGGYGYQGAQADPATIYGGVAQGPAGTYPPAAAAGQAGYAQPAQTQASYDQTVAGYGNVPAAAAATGGYPQYDSAGHTYGAHR